MKKGIKTIVLFSVIGLTGAAARAQGTGARSSGNWDDPAIWTAGTVPDLSNNVYIGSFFPPGTGAVATVTLTQDQSAGSVHLANGIFFSEAAHRD